MKIMNTKGLVQIVVMLCLALSTFSVTAHNNVVVIPLFGDAPEPVENVIVVAKANGDFTSPVEALDSIDDASESNPYLVVIAPGEYQLGAQQIVMKPFVELMGSGKVATRLVASRGSASDDASAAVIVGVDNSSISNLAIENTRVNSNSFGIYNDSANIKIQNVSIIMDSGPASGFQAGILSDASNVKILHVDIVLVDGGSHLPVFSRNGSEVNIDNITTYTSGGAFSATGIEAFNSRTSVMNGAITLENGGFRQTGIRAGNASPIALFNVKISISGGAAGGASSDQIGIALAVQPQDGGSTIDHSTIMVDGGSADFAAGVSLTQAGDLTMSNSSVSAIGATLVSRGITQNLTTTSTIRASKIIGTDSSIFLGGPGNPALAYVSDSFMEGGTDLGSGNFRCSFVFNESGSQLDNNCSTGA